ncbi:MAG: hypothetical protein IT437_07965 [Phycisphaerales bacterium]|nr:hypothetical protein [Phycisphaerales bacterium]
MSTRVYLDGRPLPVERDTLGAGLRAAADEAHRHGRIIVEATAGGAPIAEPMLEDPPDTPFDGDLRFVSVEPRDLARSTLQDAKGALEQARRAQEMGAELIGAGRPEESLKPLGEAIEVWRIVRDAVQKSVAIAPTGAGQVGLDELVTTLGATLTEIKRSLTVQDWQALSDALAYDMDEQVDRWQSLLAHMAQEL